MAIGGATVLLITPTGALLVNAVTFAISAMLIWRGIRPRPAPGNRGVRWSPLADAVEGMRYVFTDPWLRGCLLLVWLVPAFGVEAIAYPLAREPGGGPSLAGMLMATIALGYATGAMILISWIPSSVRDRILAPLAVLPGVALLPMLAHPPAPVVLLLLFCCGVGCSFGTPLNAMFVQRTDPAYRGRAMGVAIAGIAAGQGGGFLLTDGCPSSVSPLRPPWDCVVPTPSPPCCAAVRPIRRCPRVQVLSGDDLNWRGDWP
ncbi:MFS transporter [Nonomuraea sp. B19D2]|uniref:MFS transporter n=1 Tax=Nonomuraea sp. B19D2 TaxID=3159561 RepID=UPI0032DAE805